MATGRIGTTPVLRTRWSKEPAGGTTSLSGLDDYSVSLVYEVGYEAVYQNGALLSRGNDYTATDGTTITLTNATVAGDIIEVFANNVVPLTDTYSQSVADGKFVNNTIVDAKGDLIVATGADTPGRLAVGSNGQVLTAASTTGTGLAWATIASSPIKQMVITSTTTQTQETNAAYVDIDNLSVTITPASTANKILIMAAIPVTAARQANTVTRAMFQLLRGSTVLEEWERSAGIEAGTGSSGFVEHSTCFAPIYEDSPASTSALTYKFQIRLNTSGSSGIVRTNNGAGTATLIALEI